MRTRPLLRALIALVLLALPAVSTLAAATRSTRAGCCARACCCRPKPPGVGCRIERPCGTSDGVTMRTLVPAPAIPAVVRQHPLSHAVGRVASPAVLLPLTAAARPPDPPPEPTA